MSNKINPVHVFIVLISIAFLSMGCINQPLINITNNTATAVNPAADLNLFDGINATSKQVQVPAYQIAKIKDLVETYVSMQSDKNITLVYVGAVDNGEFISMNFTESNGTNSIPIFVSRNFKYIYSGAMEIDELYKQIQILKMMQDNQSNATQDNQSNATIQNNDKLAKCLTEKGVKFYGTYWCGYCKSQKELFGASASLLPYIECADPKTGSQTKECSDANITGYPTWVFPDGTRRSGKLSFEVLAQLSNCTQ